MKFFSLYRVELRRLALSKFVWVIAALSLLSPLFGYSIFLQTLSNSTMTNQYIANPIMAGTVIGAILWALLAILESDRFYRAKTDVLIDSMISPIRIILSRMFTLITLSTVTALICGIAYLPITMVKINYLFNFKLYANSFLILLLPTWWISILLALTLYQITRRIEFAVLLYIGGVYFSFSHYMWNNYFAHWINPIIVSFSDGFSNALILRITLYTRVLWLLLTAGTWVFSLLCIRRYQKRLLGSFVCGLRKIYLPFISVALLFTGVMLWVWQPLINHAPYEWNNNIYSRSDNYPPRATHAAYKLTAKKSGTIIGTAEYVLDKSDNSEALIWLDPGFKITTIRYDGKNIDFHTNNIDINEYRGTTFTIPKGINKKLTIHYQGFPKLLRSFLPFSWDNSSSADYVSLSNAATVPDFTSFSLPGKYDLELTVPKKLTPIVEHQILSDYTNNKDGSRTWKTTDAPGHLGWITACDYKNIEFQAAGTKINLLYSKKYDKNIKKYDIPKSIAEVMEYCTKHLGPLSFVENDSLMMVQRASSISGDGGNAGNGWVEWGEFLFTEKNLSDPLKGAGAAEVFAHEIIHEWWGGLGVYSEDDGLWSDEGLDVYTTYRMMKEKYGELYAKKNYIDIWHSNVDAQNRGYYYRHPEMLSKLPLKYQADLKSQEQTTNKYCRMPLMILKAEQLVGGEEKMDEILQSIQKKYAHAQPITYRDFLFACGLKERDLDLE